ncbi:hypothetical protein HYV11_02375 [Candidatus Dependentiae bacterium]|nr:hypothetical protein [Candidatus Dependentiae bacterium]
MSLTKKLFFMITTLHLSTYIQTADVNPRFESAPSHARSKPHSIWQACVEATEILNNFFKQQEENQSAIAQKSRAPIAASTSHRVSPNEAERAFDFISDFFTNKKKSLQKRIQKSSNDPVMLDNVIGMISPFQDESGFYDHRKNEIILFDSQSKVVDTDAGTFVNIKTKVAHNGTLFAKEYEGMPLIAASVTEPSKGIPGAGFTTLYYGISKKDADNVKDAAVSTQFSGYAGGTQFGGIGRGKEKDTLSQSGFIPLLY